MSVQTGIAVAVVVAVVVAAAGTATRTTDMVAATMAMATRAAEVAAAVTGGNGTDDLLPSFLPLSGTSEHCSFWIPDARLPARLLRSDSHLSTHYANRRLGICYVCLS